MKKITLCLIAVAAIGAAAAYASTQKVLVFAEPGPRTLDTVDVAKPVYVEAINAYPADGTVILKRVVGTDTNQVASVTCSGGSYTGAVTKAVYMLRGDTLLREGTATGGVVRVINEAD